ncbi:MAG: SRPBCC domain-containing protein [Bacteroidetes bacterium]|nr:SRPBCC domain-containing protein [Bacteroidota bacterium]
MRNALLFDFTVDKENNTILVKREFAADVAIIWDAFTKPEILDQWWAPKPWKARTKVMDFREGGHWIYAMVGPEGEEHWARADFQTIEPQKRYTGLDAFSDADGVINPAMPQSTWDVHFKAQDHKTLVAYHIEFGDLAQLEATIQMGFKEGLTLAMEGLDEWLEANK